MRPARAADLKLRQILQSDPGWTAYALADLFPPWNAYSRWIAGERSALLIFDGLQPPILFAHGEPTELDLLFTRLRPGEYWFTLRPTDFSRLAPRLQRFDRIRMWRMRLATGEASRSDRAQVGPRQPTSGPRPVESRKPVGAASERRESGASSPARAVGVERLGPADLAQLQQFYGSLDDGPDAFSAEQLNAGVFYGAREGGRLLSAAGTHVACRELGIAALGNLATHPEQRGRGLGYAVSRAVLGELMQQGFDTIVLNVQMDNRPAIRLYRRLGFVPYCGFYEGRATIA